ncbi:MAG: zinc-dependent metalloprotease [Actinomycetota bacterium]
MTNFPFGFSPTGGGGGTGDFSGIPFFAELQRLMSSSGGPVNWELARQMAVSSAASAAGPASIGFSGSGAGDVAESLRLAELWLDAVTTLPAGTTIAEAWTRERWVEATLATWQTLCDPVAGRVVAAMKGALPAELAESAGPLGDVMNQVGGLMFGMQVGQALGALAGEVLSSTDVGLPIGPSAVGALLPENIAAFGADLGVPAAEVQLYIALREAAYHRLFGHVPWLRGQLLSAVEAYAQGITVDTERMESAMSAVDPTDPESLQKALSGGLFEPEDTPAQRASLARLELMLALTEGWVDHVVDAAASAHLPSAAAMRETVRRRRASGGPAEQTFATLVGLELRPRRLREAAALWAALTDARGIDGRDDVWRHPDLLPDSDALSDPAAFATRSDDDVFTLGADEIDGPLGEDGPI